MDRTPVALFFLIGFLSTATGFALGTDSSSAGSGRTLKLDLFSMYNTFFDSRSQIRAGIEYEGRSRKKFSPAYHLDFGFYDLYTYDKYYDFFNTSGGMYKEETIVKTYGFHFLYGYKYRMYERKRFRYFLSLQSDLNMFRKKFSIHNTKTDILEKRRDFQIRLGLGPEAGIHYHLVKKFSLELKVATFLRILNHQSNKNAPYIKPYKAIWFDKRHIYWIIPRINLCYELNE